MNSFSLPARVIGHALRDKVATALVQGDREVSYGELLEMAGAARARIAARNIPAGQPVAVRAVKTPETVALVLGCFLAGTPVLLPAADLGSATYDELVERAECAAVLRADPAVDGADDGAADVDGTPVGQDDLALMLTTSGSTGVPKIVPITAGAVDRFTGWASAEFGIQAPAAVLNYAPLNFDLCLLDIWTTLGAGGTVVLVDQGRSTDARHIAEQLRAQRVRVVQSVPMLFRLLVDAGGGAQFPDVEHVILTGDRTAPALLAELPGLFPKARIHNVYGCTETNDSFRHEIGADAPLPAELPIGLPVAGVDAVVVDESGVVLDGACSGELLVRTPFQMTGYLRRTDQAHEFAEVEGLAGGPFFRTGDLVRRGDDGVHWLIGRNDFRVKVRGTRVNLEEIEHVLLDHPDVREAAVVGLPDDDAGVRLHAVVRGARPGVPNVLALRDHCRQRMPRAAIPSAIQVVAEDLPRTSTGKVDRRAIGRSLQNRS